MGSHHPTQRRLVVEVEVVLLCELLFDSVMMHPAFLYYYTRANGYEKKKKQRLVWFKTNRFLFLVPFFSQLSPLLFFSLSEGKTTHMTHTQSHRHTVTQSTQWWIFHSPIGKKKFKQGEKKETKQNKRQKTKEDKNQMEADDDEEQHLIDPVLQYIYGSESTVLSTSYRYDPKNTPSSRPFLSISTDSNSSAKARFKRFWASSSASSNEPLDPVVYMPTDPETGAPKAVVGKDEKFVTAKALSSLLRHDKIYPRMTDFQLDTRTQPPSTVRKFQHRPGLFSTKWPSMPLLDLCGMLYTISSTLEVTVDRIPNWFLNAILFESRCRYSRISDNPPDDDVVYESQVQYQIVRSHAVSWVSNYLDEFPFQVYDKYYPGNGKGYGLLSVSNSTNLVTYASEVLVPQNSNHTDYGLLGDLVMKDPAAPSSVENFPFMYNKFDVNERHLVVADGSAKDVTTGVFYFRELLPSDFQAKSPQPPLGKCSWGGVFSNTNWILWETKTLFVAHPQSPGRNYRFVGCLVRPKDPWVTNEEVPYMAGSRIYAVLDELVVVAKDANGNAIPGEIASEVKGLSVTYVSDRLNVVQFGTPDLGVKTFKFLRDDYMGRQMRYLEFRASKGKTDFWWRLYNEWKYAYTKYWTPERIRWRYLSGGQQDKAVYEPEVDGWTMEDFINFNLTVEITDPNLFRNVHTWNTDHYYSHFPGYIRDWRKKWFEVYLNDYEAQKVKYYTDDQKVPFDSNIRLPDEPYSLVIGRAWVDYHNHGDQPLTNASEMYKDPIKDSDDHQQKAYDELFAAIDELDKAWQFALTTKRYFFTTTLPSILNEKDSSGNKKYNIAFDPFLDKTSRAVPYLTIAGKLNPSDYDWPPASAQPDGPKCKEGYIYQGGTCKAPPGPTGPNTGSTGTHTGSTGPHTGPFEPTGPSGPSGPSGPHGGGSSGATGPGKSNANGATVWAAVLGLSLVFVILILLSKKSSSSKSSGRSSGS